MKLDALFLSSVYSVTIPLHVSGRGVVTELTENK
jgi:hypothetical protein